MRAGLIALIAGLIASPALAGTPVTLKAEVMDGDGLVTLADLFDGASAAAGKVPVAARPGPSVVLDAATVQTLARRSGLDWANAEGIRRIIVRGGAATGAGGGGAAGVFAVCRKREVEAGAAEARAAGDRGAAWA